MTWGGRRTGSGRKPKSVTDHSVVLGRVEDSDVSPAPPADLPLEESDVWLVLAPLAIEVRTLTRHTEPSFRLLCAIEAERRAVQRQITNDGRMVPKNLIHTNNQEGEELKLHPLATHLYKLYKQAEAMMARFCLAPYGRPVALEVRRVDERDKEFFESRLRSRGGASRDPRRDRGRRSDVKNPQNG